MRERVFRTQRMENDILDFFSPSSESLEEDPRIKAYDRWYRLKSKIHSFYAIKLWHPYAFTSANQHLYYVFHISVKEDDKILRLGEFSLFYYYGNDVIWNPSKDFFEPFECWIRELLQVE